MKKKAYNFSVSERKLYTIGSSGDVEKYAEIVGMSKDEFVSFLETNFGAIYSISSNNEELLYWNDKNSAQKCIFWLVTQSMGNSKEIPKVANKITISAATGGVYGRKRARRVRADARRGGLK
jgi:hypothetical protein